MKKSELKSIIKEEIKKVMSESLSSSTALDILSDPKLTQAMDQLSSEIDQQTFMKIKDLYSKLYAELKKHDVGALKEANDESELVLFTSEDTGQNNWSDYNSLVKEYPIVKKLPKDFVKKYLTLDYLYSVRTHKLNTLEKLIAKEFKKVGINAELGEGDDTTIEMYFN